MATFVQSAPLPELSGTHSPLVEDPEFYVIAQRSQSLVKKILLAIPKTHKSCIHIETLILNSAENGKFVIMASSIGIPSPPVLKVIGENFTLETSLRWMSEGLQLHRALLQGVITRLANKDTVTGLLSDTRDLLIQIHKMLKMVRTGSQVQPTAPTLALSLPGEYEVQVATHLTLVQFQSFGQDMVRSLRNITQEDEQLTDG